MILHKPNKYNSNSLWYKTEKIYITITISHAFRMPSTNIIPLTKVW